jgi:hypothetical protein
MDVGLGHSFAAASRGRFSSSFSHYLERTSTTECDKRREDDFVSRLDEGEGNADLLLRVTYQLTP